MLNLSSMNISLIVIRDICLADVFLFNDYKKKSSLGIAPKLLMYDPLVREF